MVKQLQFLVISLFFLTGCGKSILDTQDARCPFTERGGCQSMEMVNKMVTQKRYTPDGQFVQQAGVDISHPAAVNNQPRYLRWKAASLKNTTK